MSVLVFGFSVGFIASGIIRASIVLFVIFFVSASNSKKASPKVKLVLFEDFGYNFC